MLPIFIGSDPRTPTDTSVLIHSINELSTIPVAITTLKLSTLPITRRGLTDFTFSRFLCPYLCGYKGYSVFLDNDMLLLTDISEIFQGLDPEAAVSVVPFEGSLAFERSSAMVFNNELCKQLTPEFIDDTNNSLFDFKWASKVGRLDKSWNYLPLYHDIRDFPRISLVHFTAGTPNFPELSDCDYSLEWYNTKADMLKSCSWLFLHGNSVHCNKVLDWMKSQGKL